MHFSFILTFLRYSDMAIGLGRYVWLPLPGKFQLSIYIEEHYGVLAALAHFAWYLVPGLCVYSAGRQPSQGVRKHIRNILVVWLLTGIWHGASWNFVRMGRLLLVFCCCWKSLYLEGGWKSSRLCSSHIYCMFFVMLGWNLFVFEDFGSGIAYLKALFGLYGQGLGDRETTVPAVQQCSIACIADPWQYTHSGAARKVDLPEAGRPGAGAHDAAESVLRRHFSFIGRISGRCVI